MCIRDRAYIEEQKTRGKDEIPENLTEKMYGAITSFKEKYTMIHRHYNLLLSSTIITLCGCAVNN